jgi:hypothetical protein
MAKRSFKKKSPRKMRPSTYKRWVWQGKIKKTPSGLFKKDLVKNKHGKIVSRKKHSLGKRMVGGKRR